MKVGCLTEFQCAVYADGELPAPEARAVAEHLEVCASCRQLVGALRVESRVLVECFQSTDLIEFELEDEVLSAPQAQSLGVARFAAFVLAMSVLLRPVLNVMEEVGLLETLNWLVITAAYVVPAGISFLSAILSNAAWIAFSAVLFLAVVVFSRRSVVTSSILSVLALLTVFSSSSYGLDFRSGDQPVTVPSGETIDDTLVVAGDSVTIDGTVAGDVIALVREVTIRGTVKGNVVSLARRVQLEGTIEGSVIGFAQYIQTRGRIAHNIFAFAQTTDISRDATIDQNAVLFAGESDIAGTIGKDAITGAASVNVSAPARIGGNLTAKVSGSRNVRIAPEAMIAGRTDIQTPQPAPSRYATLSFYVWQTIWLTAAFLTGLLLFWVVPALSRLTIDTTHELLLSAGVGLLALVAVPVAAVVAAITLIGLPVAFIGFACWLIAAYLAKIIAAGFLGRSLLAGHGEAEPSKVLALLVGLVLVFVAINLPYVGGLVNFFLIVLGLGMLVIRAYRTPGWRPAQAA